MLGLLGFNKYELHLDSARSSQPLSSRGGFRGISPRQEIMCPPMTILNHALHLPQFFVLFSQLAGFDVGLIGKSNEKKRHHQFVEVFSVHPQHEKQLHT